SGVPPDAIETAALWIGQAERAMGLHARGIEHSSKGVENCLSMINLFAVTGHFGREWAGCLMITGQGNGQGGREHGQKCDQLPGGRKIDNPEHRAQVAKVWGIAPEELPPAGVDAYETFRKIDRGEIRGLLSISFNPLVSLPDSDFIRRMLEKLDFYVAI